MKVSDLKPNARNPRKISQSKLGALHKSIQKYGDLGGVVFNRRTGRLIGAHQRSKGLPQTATIHISQKYDKPTRCNTVALGYIDVDGERFNYREVDADEKWETEAMLAANRHGGEWDGQVMRVVLADFPDLDTVTAGFEPMELIPFGVSHPAPAPAPLGSDEPFSPESDAAYVRDTPQTTEQIPTSPIGESSPFESVNENTTPQGRRIIIIIDCPTDAVKSELRESIRGVVEKSGAKFF